MLSATVASKVLGVVRTFWLARVLDPADYGMWIFISLIYSYTPILGLGMGDALLKKVPFFLGKRDVESLKAVEGGVLSYSLLLAVVIVPLIVLLPRLFVSESLSRFARPAQLMLVALCIASFSSFFIFRLQAYQKFAYLSKIVLVRAIAFLVLQIGFGYVFGLIGAIVGFLACEICICLYSGLLNTKLPNTISVKFSGALYGNLIGTGLPITIIGWTSIIQMSVDRVVSMTMLGDVQTGFYGIGMSIAFTFLLIPDAINQVLYPNVNKKYGQTSNRRDLIPLVVEPARIMSLLLPLFAFISLLLLPLIFRFIVPKYIPGLQATQILILAALFSGMTKSGANLLISIDRCGRLVLYNLAGVLLNVAGNFLLVKAGFGINGIAAATAISANLMAVAIWASTFSGLNFPALERIKRLGQLFMPLMLFTIFSLVDSYVANRFGLGSVFSSYATFSSFVLYWVVLLAFPDYRKLAKESIQSGVATMKSHKRGDQLAGRANL